MTPATYALLRAEARSIRDGVRLFSELVHPVLGYVYTITVGVSFFVSLVSFRFAFEGHLKFFSILLGITFLVEVLTMILIEGMHVKSTQWVYNVFIPVEFACYGFYYLQILRTRPVRILVKVLTIVVPVAGVVSSIFVFDFYHWNSYQAMGAALCTVVFAICYYRELYLSNEKFTLSSKPEFWIATGMILFYSCQLPFLGTVNYLVKISMELAMTMVTVLRIIDILMYLIFCYAYLCRIAIKK